MRLTLPIPPSVNQCYRRSARGIYKTDHATVWQTSAGWLAKQWWKGSPTDKQVVLNVWVFWNDKRRRDTDNLFKLLMDSLTGIVWVDDRQVMPRVMGLEVDKGNGRIEIEAEVLE